MTSTTSEWNLKCQVGKDGEHFLDYFDKVKLASNCDDPSVIQHEVVCTQS